MRRKLLFILGILFLGSVSYAQVIDESFETWPPTGWTLDPSSGSGSWQQDDGSTHGPGSAYDGSYAAMFDNYTYSSGVTGDLITPVFDVSSYTNPVLSFYWWNNDGSSSPASIDVYTTPDGSTWTLLEHIDTYGSGATTWVHYTRGFATTVTQIKLTATSDYGLKNTFVDKFVISDESCPDPSAQTESNITASSADLGWTENGSATIWNIEYGPTGFSQGSGTTVSGVTSNPYTLSGLSDNTTYDWYVQADCGSGSTSNWTGPSTFTTTCATKTAPWSDDFEAHTATTNSTWGNCWSSDPSGTASSFRWDLDASGSTPSSSTGPDGAHSGSKYAYTEASSGSDGDSAFLFSPYVDISGLTTPELTFYYHMYGATMGTMRVDIYDGTSWHYGVYSKSGQQQSSGSDPWEKAIVNLSSYSGTIRVRFTGIRGSDYTGDMSIDDFDIHEAPSCPDPSDQTESNITTSSADLGWTENGSATTWNIEYGPEGFSQGSGTTVSGVTSNPYTLSGLSDNTSYDWYVQADCGSGSTSNWVGPSNFSTLCNATNLPYFQGFDDVTSPDFPDCMTVENTNGDSKYWQTSTTHNSAPNSAKISYNGSEAMDDWFFTQGLNLTGGVTYEVTFVYKCFSSNYPEKLAVHWGSSANSSAMSGSAIFDNNNITNTTWAVGSGTFNPSTSGVYYIGFHGYSDADQYYLYVDDIQVVQYQLSTTWNGTSDNDWRNTGNWSNGWPPGSLTDVTIPADKTNYPTLTSTGYCDDITVQSSSSGDGSLIGVSHLMVSGTSTVQRYLTGGQWHEVSAMVENATVNSFFFNHSPDVWMNKYEESTDSRTAITDLTTAMPLGTGFEAWVKTGNNATALFTGTINGNSITPTLTYTDDSHGYNLVGNPFSSAIQWGAGTWNLTNVDDQVWVWNGTTWVDYVSGTGAGSLTNGIIPMGQGFFVHTNAASPSMTIPTDAQVHNSQEFYKVEQEPQHIILEGEKEGKKDQLWIVFHEGSDESFENGYDGRKMITTREGSAPQIYSREGEEFFSIDALPPVGEEGRVIPVYFKANENGEQTIRIIDLEQIPNVTAVLEDTRTGILQNLNKKPEYTFNAVTYQNPERFILHLNRSANSIDDHNLKRDIHVYAFDKSIYIDCRGDAVNVKKEVRIYDLTGREIMVKTIPPGDLIRIPVNLPGSYLIVKVISSNEVSTAKVFIK